MWLATILSIVVLAIIFTSSGWPQCFKLWFTRSYWTNYNIVEALAWGAKAVIIIPGLVFGVQVWQLYFITLATSASLIWVNSKKLLPSLIAFNAVWVWLSLVVIVKNVI